MTVTYMMTRRTCTGIKPPNDHWLGHQLMAWSWTT